ncbi:hypothetical protein B0H11DRAFT_2366902, partial [Mycena galericulata]
RWSSGLLCDVQHITCLTVFWGAGSNPPTTGKTQFRHFPASHCRFSIILGFVMSDFGDVYHPSLMATAPHHLLRPHLIFGFQPEITRRPAHFNLRSIPFIPKKVRAAPAAQCGIVRSGFPSVDVAWGPIGGQQKETEKSLHCAEKGNSISLGSKNMIRVGPRDRGYWLGGGWEREAGMGSSSRGNDHQPGSSLQLTAASVWVRKI